LHYFEKKDSPQSAVTLWSALHAVKCVVRVDFRVFRRKKKSRFLDDVRIVEALNEPVDDSGSDGDVTEADYSPFDSGI